MDLRDMAPVRSVFGKRRLTNPLNTTEFGFATAEEAEPAEVTNKSNSVYNCDVNINFNFINGSWLGHGHGDRGSDKQPSVHDHLG